MSTNPLSTQNMVAAEFDARPEQQQRVRKRRRRTMACTQCRSRKLRCDREYPTCGRCRKSKTPTKCTYEDGFLWQQPTTVTSTVFSDQGSTALSVGRVTDRTSMSTPPDSALKPQPFRPQEQPPVLGRPQEERRDRFLETVLGAPKAAVDQEPYVAESLPRLKRSSIQIPAYTEQIVEDESPPLSPTQPVDLVPRIMMRGKETKTRFNGSGISANVMSQFADIKSFAEEIRLSNPNLARLRPDLEKVKRGLYRRRLSDPLPESPIVTLISMLPSRQSVDELVSLYLAYVESVHRILHVPTFLRELEDFWMKKDTPDLVSPAFVVQLLLMMACAWNLADQNTLYYKNESPMSCSVAIEWILHAEKWIQAAQVKRPEITAIRLYCLLIIAQNSLGMKRSKAWLATGTLIKQAMLSGYHRDASRHSKISGFIKEMRRRIWATIVELDLQVSLDRGMPPSIQASDYDTAPVSNLNDVDLREGMTELPAARPLDEITDSSFQAIMSQSLMLRLKVGHLMHSPRLACSYEEVLRMDWEFNKHLAAIPKWAQAEMGDLLKQRKLLVWKTLSETRMSQALLCLHTPFAIESAKVPLFVPSEQARLTAATNILSSHKRLQDSSKSLALCSMGDWTIQACGSICQSLYASSNSNATTLTRTLPGFAENLVLLVEAAIAALETRAFCVVKGAKDYFFMSTLLALVKTRLWEDQAGLFKQEVVDRILAFTPTLYARHANCSHLDTFDMCNFKPKAVGNFPPPSDMIVPMNGENFEPILPGMNFGITPPGELDAFLDVFDWEDVASFAFAE
ncbi:hypothetical protein ASPZODRAFT_93608 [Penicilliopsis zonata CBS 506.65]|uniref:Zn(2)-C6 fungal-type domain-containing protein n=1 Tax=Penicilliopsis zonata CBS 506.65 TaxID=1073090 RepID=A0A1L9SN94_9EURO|nr:hypothetical protein ASPZODRAFT_93608 [Penicilliopsis zonata CBS 506.65]OJJ48670.1 hypothetical protein ASPZODRAFT_93608 [Penicilliopsis zonata CBS 506.65]